MRRGLRTYRRAVGKQGRWYGAVVEGGMIETLHPLEDFAALLRVVKRVFSSMNSYCILGEQQHGQAQYACSKKSTCPI